MINKNATRQKTERRRQSVPLEKPEVKELLKLIAERRTKVDAAEYIGIDRNTLRNVLLAKSGAPETIQLIRDAIAAKV